MKAAAKFSVGIDLGTTNSVIAYTPLGGDAVAPPKVLAVPQLVAAATVEAREVLPSFLYLATEGERAGLGLPCTES